MALADAPAQWITLIPPPNTPEGLKGRDGRGPYRFDPDEVIRSTEREGHLPVIDFDHALEGDPDAQKAGYVISQVAHEGALMGKVLWTEAGYRAVREKEYRYISPVFALKDGEITALLRAGLTNTPNLFGTAIVIQSGERQTERRDNNDQLTELEAKMAKHFGVSEDDFRKAKLRAGSGQKEVDRNWRPAAGPSRLERMFG
jgi:phage I-like protein